MPDIFVANGKSKETNTKTLTSKPNADTDVKPFKSNQIPEGNPVHILSAFCKNPSDIKFRNQEQEEKVLLFVRRSFITNFPWIFIGAVLLVLPFFFGAVTNSLNFHFEIISGKFLLFFTLFYYLCITTYLFINFIVWYFNVSLVTNIRVVDVDVEGVVYKNVATTKLTLVQDVNYTQTGVLRTIFDYGDVTIQTAAEQENFDLTAVPRPEDVVHILGDLIGRGGRHV